MTFLLPALLLAAAPLSVRVLEAERPGAVWVAGGEVRCDGSLVPTPVEVAVSGTTLRAGAAPCTAVELGAGVAFRLAPAGPAHRYPGPVRVGRELSVLSLVAEVALEDYVAQVVATAWPEGGPAAALEAQAVVARTFALAGLRRHAARGHQLCDAAHCQLLAGVPAGPGAREAARRTQGQVLLAGGVALRPARSHPACGGRTSASEDVFGEPGPGPGVVDADGPGQPPRCQAAPGLRWERTVPVGLLGADPQAPAGATLGPLVEVLRRDAAGAVLEVRAGGRRFTGLELVAWLQAQPDGVALPSPRFTAVDLDGEVRFSGSGAGHGVGLCQVGAAALADRKRSFADILRAYFPGARLAPAP